MEIITGCNTIQKRKEVEEMLAVYNQVTVNEIVINKAISLIKRYSIHSLTKLNKSISIPDCIIAASAIVHDLPLLTFNKKDFDFIKEIKFHELSL